MYVITEDGARRLPDDEMGPIVRAVVEGRLIDPDGPNASPPTGP